MIIRTIFLSISFFLYIGTLHVHGQITKNKEVTDLIEKKRTYNKNNGFGFRIQIDNGFEVAVKKTRNLFKFKFPTITSYILFESPEWKTQVGDYKTRLEADKALNMIKVNFPNAIVVPR